MVEELRKAGILMRVTRDSKNHNYCKLFSIHSIPTVIFKRETLDSEERNFKPKKRNCHLSVIKIPIHI